MTSTSIIYPLIHALMTLRMVVTCIIYKILHNSDFEKSKYNSDEMEITVSILKNS